jgi:phage terminase large subunit GpA-like protein
VITPSKGMGVKAGNKPFREWGRKPGDRIGRDWRIDAATQGRGRHVVFDANSWKSFVADRLLSPEGSAGCLWLPGTQPHAHQLLADHLSCESRVKTEGRGRELEEWSKRPGCTENHWLDCLVMAAIAASVQGLKWSPAGAAGESDAGGEPKKRMKLSDMQAQKRKVRA